jgi:hypothetical protein
MVLDDSKLQPFWQWLVESLPYGLAVYVVLLVGLLAIGFVIAAVRNGPGRAGDIVFSTLRDAWRDFAGISPRRVYALARLAVQESIRRRVLVAFVVFVVLLVFAGWFLDPATNEPAKLYLSFVMSFALYLVLGLALLLSAFSLPADIKARTIYTIVTKPVRPIEIILGRIIGFTVVGTALLALMGGLSYVFVTRSLQHTHELPVAEVHPITEADEGPEALVAEGRTSLVHNHRHTVSIFRDDTAETDFQNGHRHSVTIEKDSSGEPTRYVLGAPQGLLQARVPIYGTMQFRDRTGAMGRTGTNVGYEWEYRSYIEGGTPAAGVWRFINLRPEQFPNGVPIELTIRVFRTYKGDIERTVMGRMILRNPKTGLGSDPITFRAKEFTVDNKLVPLKLTSQGTTIDLFKDLVSDGELQLELQCLEPGQFYGMARADVYLKAADASFAANLLKGYFGIWLQMVLVVGFGVRFSTFLSEAVAALGTVGAIVGGFFLSFMVLIATGQTHGGGPSEAFFRTLAGKSIGVDLEEGVARTVLQGFDRGIAQPLLWTVSHLLPNFAELSSIDYVVYGFNIPGDLLLRHTLVTFLYLLPIAALAYLFLKTREVAK